MVVEVRGRGKKEEVGRACSTRFIYAEVVVELCDFVTQQTKHEKCSLEWSVLIESTDYGLVETSENKEVYYHGPVPAQFPV